MAVDEFLWKISKTFYDYTGKRTLKGKKHLIGKLDIFRLYGAQLRLVGFHDRQPNPILIGWLSDSLLQGGGSCSFRRLPLIVSSSHEIPSACLRSFISENLISQESLNQENAMPEYIRCSHLLSTFSDLIVLSNQRVFRHILTLLWEI